MTCLDFAEKHLYLAVLFQLFLFLFLILPIHVEGFFAVCKSYEFWKCILTAEGTCSEKVLQHPWVVNARSYIINMAKSLGNKSITFLDLKKLVGNGSASPTLQLNPEFDINQFMYPFITI